MRRAIAVILPLLILGAASLAQGQSASADSESEASDFLKELKAAAESDNDSSEVESAEDDGQEEDAAEESKVAIKPRVKKSDNPQDQQMRRKKIFRYTAIGLDVLGAGVFAYGLYENSNVAKHTEKVSKNGREYFEDIKAAKNAVTKRNAAYIVGSVFLASGITIHILF
jgi:hypothetical protein